MALVYAALTLGSLLIALLTFGIARVAGIPVKSARYFALPFACLFACLLLCLPPFAIWMVRQTRREKAWNWHQARLGEVLLMEWLSEQRAQGEPLGRDAGAKRLTAEQINEMDRDWERRWAQREHRSNGMIALAGLIVGLAALSLWLILDARKRNIALIAMIPMALGLFVALIFGITWLLERSTIRGDLKKRRFMGRVAKEARLVEAEYSRETGERWVTALAGSVERPFESRVDLARREDGWVVRETREEPNGLFAYVERTTSHRLAKDYFANHSVEDFLALLSQWFPERNFDGVRSNTAVRALFAGGEPELASRAGVEWIERFYSEDNGGPFYLFDLVRVGEEYFMRDGSFELTQDGARCKITRNHLSACYFRDNAVEDLIELICIWENSMRRESRRHIRSEEKQRLRESPRLRALFAGKRSIPADEFCCWFRLRWANEPTLRSVEINLLDPASHWTFWDSMDPPDEPGRFLLPPDGFSPEALPRTLALEAFSRFNEERSRAALAAALSAIGGAYGRVAELYSRKSEFGSGGVVERLELYRDSSGRFFLRHRWMVFRRIPTEYIEIHPLPEDCFRTHAMEEFIEAARSLCFKEIDAEALRRNPALQALFGNSQPNLAPRPES